MSSFARISVAVVPYYIFGLLIFSVTSAGAQTSSQFLTVSDGSTQNLGSTPLETVLVNTQGNTIPLVQNCATLTIHP